MISYSLTLVPFLLLDGPHYGVGGEEKREEPIIYDYTQIYLTLSSVSVHASDLRKC